MKRTAMLNPVARAMIVKEWQSEAVTGMIHVLTGQDSRRLVNGAGRVFYVLLGACRTCAVPESDPDVRILMGAVNAAHDQADVEEIMEMRRASLLSGLAACERLLDRVTHRALADAAIEMKVRLARQDITHEDFQRFIGAAA